MALGGDRKLNRACVRSGARPRAADAGRRAGAARGARLAMVCDADDSMTAGVLNGAGQTGRRAL